MPDVFTPEKRSAVMACIRGWDTKPELALRKMLHRLGYRFTVNSRNNKQLPGRPDLVLPKFHTVVFVHGCFWHGHEHCRHFRLPGSRREWWTAKIDGNRARDLRNEAALLALGWHVVNIWECALKTAAARLWLTEELPGLLGDGGKIDRRDRSGKVSKSASSLDPLISPNEIASKNPQPEKPRRRESRLPARGQAALGKR